MNKISAFFEKEEKEILCQLEYFSEVLLHLRYEGKVQRGKNVKAANKAIAKLIKILRKHRSFQEKVIFSYLLVHIPKHESIIQFLCSDHEIIQKNKKKLYCLLKKLSEKESYTLDDKIQELGVSLIYLVRHHIELERNSIHKTLKNELNEDEKKDVAKMTRNWFVTINDTSNCFGMQKAGR